MFSAVVLLCLPPWPYMYNCYLPSYHAPFCMNISCLWRDIERMLYEVFQFCSYHFRLHVLLFSCYYCSIQIPINTRGPGVIIYPIISMISFITYSPLPTFLNQCFHFLYISAVYICMRSPYKRWEGWVVIRNVILGSMRRYILGLNGKQ